MRLIWDEEAWDEKNRLVFRVTESSIEIAQCGSHYRDK
jgi:Txe/YoeB family toxin of Txe-Axe toxin-antitoxin module